MREADSGSAKFRRLPAAFAVLAIAAGGVVWSGCGSSGDSTGTTVTDGGNAQQEIEEGTKKAEEGVKKGSEEAKKGLEEAKKEAEKGIEEGAAQAEKGIEEAKKQAEKYLP